MNLAVPLFSSYALNLILGGQMEASIIVVRVNSSWGRYKKHRIISNNINQKNFMKKLIRKFWDYYTVCKSSPSIDRDVHARQDKKKQTMKKKIRTFEAAGSYAQPKISSILKLLELQTNLPVSDPKKYCVHPAGGKLSDPHLKLLRTIIYL